MITNKMQIKFNELQERKKDIVQDKERKEMSYRAWKGMKYNNTDDSNDDILNGSLIPDFDGCRITKEYKEQIRDRKVQSLLSANTESTMYHEIHAPLLLDLDFGVVQKDVRSLDYELKEKPAPAKLDNNIVFNEYRVHGFLPQVTFFISSGDSSGTPYQPLCNHRCLAFDKFFQPDETTNQNLLETLTTNENAMSLDSATKIRATFYRVVEEEFNFQSAGNDPMPGTPIESMTKVVVQRGSHLGTSGYTGRLLMKGCFAASVDAVCFERTLDLFNLCRSRLRKGTAVGAAELHAFMHAIMTRYNLMNETDRVKFIKDNNFPQSFALKAKEACVFFAIVRRYIQDVTSFRIAILDGQHRCIGTRFILEDLRLSSNVPTMGITGSGLLRITKKSPLHSLTNVLFLSPINQYNFNDSIRAQLVQLGLDIQKGQQAQLFLGWGEVFSSAFQAILSSLSETYKLLDGMRYMPEAYQDFKKLRDGGWTGDSLVKWRIVTLEIVISACQEIYGMYQTLFHDRPNPDKDMTKLRESFRKYKSGTQSNIAITKKQRAFFHLFCPLVVSVKAWMQLIPILQLIPFRLSKFHQWSSSPWSTFNEHSYLLWMMYVGSL